MRAIITTGPGRLDVTEASSAPADDHARVRLGRAGICGTDLKILDGSPPIHYPRVLGHEMVGTVTKAASAGKLAVGTRVLVNPGVYCGACYLCTGDKPHLCPRGGLRGRDVDGVFTESLTVEERFLHPVPEQIPWDDAALTQVLGTVVHAQQTVAVNPETVAVVIGLGVSGLLHTQLLADRGVKRIVGVTRTARKLRLAEQLGAQVAVTPDQAEAVVAEVSGGRGADLVIEAVGTGATVRQAIELCGLGANVILYGIVTKTGAQMPYYQLYYKELTLHSPRAALPREYQAAVDLTASRRIRMDALITARYPLEEAAEAFQAARRGEELKVLLTP